MRAHTGDQYANSFITSGKRLSYEEWFEQLFDGCEGHPAASRGGGAFRGASDHQSEPLAILKRGSSYAAFSEEESRGDAHERGGGLQEQSRGHGCSGAVVFVIVVIAAL